MSNEDNVIPINRRVKRTSSNNDRVDKFKDSAFCKSPVMEELADCLNKNSGFKNEVYYSNARLAKRLTPKRLTACFGGRLNEDYCVMELGTHKACSSIFVMLDKAILYSTIDILLGGRDNHYTKIEGKWLTDIEMDVLTNLSHCILKGLATCVFKTINKLDNYSIKKIETDISAFKTTLHRVGVVSLEISNHLVVDKNIFVAFNPRYLKAYTVTQILNEIRDSATKIGPQALSELIRNEHPQFIAALCSILDDNEAKKIIERLPEALHTEIFLRVSNLDKITKDNSIAILDVLQSFQASLRAAEQDAAFDIGGVNKTVQILKLLPKDAFDQILGDIYERDEEYYQFVMDALNMDQKSS